MPNIKVLIADNSFLIRKGLCALIKQNKEFVLVGEAEKAEELNEKLLLHNPDVLIMDYNSRCFCLDDIFIIRQYFPKVNILAITHSQPKIVISKALEYGIISHLLKDCGEEEIIESIYSTAKGEKFLCGKIVDLMVQERKVDSARISCDGIKLSDREIEIIQSVAEGLPNKQIADKLCISVHTVMTHRKNIMNKLKINNAASLVMFALQQNLINTSQIA